MPDVVNEVKVLAGEALELAKKELSAAEAELKKLEGFKHEVSRLYHRLVWFTEHGSPEEIATATQAHADAVAAHEANPVTDAQRDAAAQKVLDLRAQTGTP